MTKIRLTGEMPPSMKWMIILVGMLISAYYFNATQFHFPPEKAPYLYLVTSGAFLMLRGIAIIFGWDFEDKSYEVVKV